MWKYIMALAIILSATIQPAKAQPAEDTVMFLVQCLQDGDGYLREPLIKSKDGAIRLRYCALQSQQFQRCRAH
jgi:hypothetical protein